MADRPIGLLRQLKCLWEITDALQEGGVGSGQGPKGDKGDPGEPGEDGLSAYQVAVANGFQGNEAAWLASLQGEDGEPGADGAPGLPGADGADSTVPGPKGDKGDKGDPGDTGLPGADGSDGAPGTPGDDGADGLSAYQVAVANGFVGNEAAWLASLVGPAGQDGEQGIQGIQGEPGTGADPWTYIKLANDFTTNSATAVDITGLAFTPSANLQYEFEVCLFMRTATATVGPRPGIGWPGGVTDAVGDAYASISATSEVQAHGNANAAVLAASTALANTTQSFSGRIYGAMKMGGSPSGTLRIQLASETAGTNVTAKAGSFLKYRSI